MAYNMYGYETAHTSTSEDLENAEKFLTDNNVHEEWIKLIKNDIDAIDALIESLQNLDKFNGQKKIHLPERNNILHALRYQPPNKIKVILVLTTLFLKMQQDWHFHATHGNPQIEKMNEALEAAGLKQYKPSSIGEYDYTHWAKNGALLLNAALTVTKGVTPRQEKYDYHRHWISFTTRIVQLAIDQSPNKNKLVGMFWCDFAREIFDQIRNRPQGFKAYDHPTWNCGRDQERDNNFHVNAIDQFRTHYPVFKSLQTGETDD